MGGGGCTGRGGGGPHRHLQTDPPARWLSICCCGHAWSLGVSGSTLRPPGVAPGAAGCALLHTYLGRVCSLGSGWGRWNTRSWTSHLRKQRKQAKQLTVSCRARCARFKTQSLWSLEPLGACLLLEAPGSGTAAVTAHQRYWGGVLGPSLQRVPFACMPASCKLAMRASFFRV